MCPIWLVRDLNVKAPAPETNAFPLDRDLILQLQISSEVFFNFKVVNNQSSTSSV